MNDKIARSLFMDYLYDEISETNKEKLESYLEKNPELKQELDEFKKTRSLLQQMPDSEPAQPLLVTEPRNRTFSQWWHEAKNLLPHSSWRKATLAAAAGFILFFFIGSLAQLHISTSQNGVTVAFGGAPAADDEFLGEQTEALVRQIREENAAILADYAESIEQQNQEQLQQVVAYFEEQRMNDLRLVNQAIDELQQNTNYQLYQTNEYLSEVLQTVSYQNQN